ncbi:MAG TPA: hypothetical protein V6C72_03460, partial [Chroococcales cyanobacterium]
MTDFAGSFADSAFVKPLDGAAQLLHLPEIPTISGSDQPGSAAKSSVASEVGSALGMVVPYFVLSKGVDFALGGAAAGEAAESVMTANSIALKSSIARAGLTGAIYGGIFTPTEGGSLTDTLKQRLTNTALDGSTFALFSGASTALGNSSFLSKIGTQGAGGIAKDMAVNAVAGLPAGLWSAEAGSLATTGHTASLQDAASAAGQYALFGGAFAGLSRGTGFLKSARQNSNSSLRFRDQSAAGDFSGQAAATDSAGRLAALAPDLDTTDL